MSYKSGHFCCGVAHSVPNGVERTNITLTLPISRVTEFYTIVLINQRLVVFEKEKIPK